jgi:hypothetical protein
MSDDAARRLDPAGSALEQAWLDVVECHDDEVHGQLHAAIQTTALLVLTREISLGCALDEHLYVEAAYRCGVHVREIRSRLAAAMMRARIHESPR